MFIAIGLGKEIGDQNSIMVKFMIAYLWIAIDTFLQQLTLL
jgi:hypothetical protein